MLPITGAKSTSSEPKDAVMLAIVPGSALAITIGTEVTLLLLTMLVLKATDGAGGAPGILSYWLQF